MDDDRNEAERTLGEDWVDPRHLLILNALEEHPELALIEELQRETDEHGERRWSLCRHLDDDGCVQVWLRPWPLDRFDEPPPIKIGAWPMKEGEVEPLPALSPSWTSTTTRPADGIQRTVIGVLKVPDEALSVAGDGDG
jgi:hypothetical protein